MDTTSAAALARELGTNTPRVLRAVQRLGMDPRRTVRGALHLNDTDVRRLRDALGVCTTIQGLRRPQVLALAALAGAPLGLRSARALSRAAGLSPTAAGTAVRQLTALGLVEIRRETVAEGKARVVDLITADVTHPRWAELAPQLAHVVLRPTSPTPPRRIPARIAHVFWNGPVGQVDPRTHGAYIARRVLTDGETQALAWAARTLTAADWTAALRTRGLGPRERALARNLAASAP